MKRMFYLLRSAFRLVRSFFWRIIIEFHLYKKIELPESDVNRLYNKWPYINPHCVDDSFISNNTQAVYLSIIIPLYNSLEYIDRIVYMLCNQKTQYSFEVLLINDGSNDGTDNVVQTRINDKPLFRYFEQDNGGISKARNLGISMAKGKYISFIDHDDEITEDYVQKLINAAEINKSEIVVCSYAQKYGNTIINSGKAKGYVWGGVFYYELFRKIRFPDGYWYEDMINNFIIKPQTDKIFELDEVLYYKNSTKRNASKKTWTSRNYKCLEHIYLVMSLIDDYRVLGLEDKEYLFNRVLIECSTLAYERTKDLDLETRMQVFLACCNSIKRVDDNSNRIVKPYKDNIFYDALRNKDFTKWELASKL